MKHLVLGVLACTAAAQAQTVLVKPYVQPGNGPTLTGSDVKVLTWITDQVPGDFTVEYGWRGAKPMTAEVIRVAMDFDKVKPKPKKPAAKPADPKAVPPSKDPATPVPAAKPATTRPAAPATPDQPAVADSVPTAKLPAAPSTASVDSTSAPAAQPDGKNPSTKPNPLEDPALTIDELKSKIVETFKPIEEKEQHFYRYRAVLPNLPFNTQVGYRVRLGHTVIREGALKTRATADQPVRFIAVGDIGSNRKEQFAVAYEISLQKPDFMVALGDIVYPGGRALQYMNHFWPCYNDVAKPSLKTGAPIAATIPIYPVIGNHDADMQKFPDYPDAYSAFYWFSVPKNGPGAGPWNTPLGKDSKLINNFKAIAGDEFPAMSDYSFDYGAAHFLMLDTNGYAMKEVSKIAPWIERDLTESRQPWKFVCFHQPAFHTSKEHYTEQRMRLLEPLFERCGVSVVFAGHVHNYQRSRPFTFTPNPPVRDPRGRVNGDFVIDSTFDGVKDTTPEGIIHIVSGGGGAALYSVNLQKTIEFLKKEDGANYVPITDKYVAEKNSFSVIDLTPTTFELRQVTVEGKEVDHFRITKAVR